MTAALRTSTAGEPAGSERCGAWRRPAQTNQPTLTRVRAGALEGGTDSPLCRHTHDRLIELAKRMRFLTRAGAGVIGNVECVEVTPKHLRVRKLELSAKKRHTARSRKSAVSGHPNLGKLPAHARMTVAHSHLFERGSRVA
jgi:hypothetical protein